MLLINLKSRNSLNCHLSKIMADYPICAAVGKRRWRFSPPPSRKIVARKKKVRPPPSPSVVRVPTRDFDYLRSRGEGGRPTRVGISIPLERRRRVRPSATRLPRLPGLPERRGDVAGGGGTRCEWPFDDAHVALRAPCILCRQIPRPPVRPMCLARLEFDNARF